MSDLLVGASSVRTGPAVGQLDTPGDPGPVVCLDVASMPAVATEAPREKPVPERAEVSEVIKVSPATEPVTTVASEAREQTVAERIGNNIRTALYIASNNVISTGVLAVGASGLALGTAINLMGEPLTWPMASISSVLLVVGVLGLKTGDLSADPAEKAAKEANRAQKIAEIEAGYKEVRKLLSPSLVSGNDFQKAREFLQQRVVHGYSRESSEAQQMWRDGVPRIIEDTAFLRELGEYVAILEFLGVDREGQDQVRKDLLASHKEFQKAAKNETR